MMFQHFWITSVSSGLTRKQLISKCYTKEPNWIPLACDLRIQCQLLYDSLSREGKWTVKNTHNDAYAQLPSSRPTDLGCDLEELELFEDSGRGQRSLKACLQPFW